MEHSSTQTVSPYATAIYMIMMPDDSVGCFVIQVPNHPKAINTEILRASINGRTPFRTYVDAHGFAVSLEIETKSSNGIIVCNSFMYLNHVNGNDGNVVNGGAGADDVDAGTGSTRLNAH